LWWARRLEGRANVRLAPQPHDVDPAVLQEILMLRGDYEIGSLKFLVCDECRLGCVAKIEVAENHQGRGLGTRALELARSQAPGYRWCTTSQDDTAVTFWQRIARRDATSEVLGPPAAHRLGPSPQLRSGRLDRGSFGQRQQRLRLHYLPMRLDRRARHTLQRRPISLRQHQDPRHPATIRQVANSTTHH
jgi:hypothetical protein